MSKPSKIDALMLRWVMPLVGQHQAWADAITGYLSRGDRRALAELLKHADPPALAREFVAELAAGRIRPSRAGRPRKHKLPQAFHVWAAIQAMREMGASKADAEHFAAVMYELDNGDVARGIVDNMREAGMRWDELPDDVRERYRAVVRAIGVMEWRFPPPA